MCCAAAVCARSLNEEVVQSFCHEQESTQPKRVKCPLAHSQLRVAMHLSRNCLLGKVDTAWVAGGLLLGSFARSRLGTSVSIADSRGKAAFLIPNLAVDHDPRHVLMVRGGVFIRLLEQLLRLRAVHASLESGVVQVGKLGALLGRQSGHSFLTICLDAVVEWEPVAGVGVVRDSALFPRVANALELSMLALYFAGQRVVLGVAERHRCQVRDGGNLRVVDGFGQVLRDEVLASASEALGADQQVNWVCAHFSRSSSSSKVAGRGRSSSGGREEHKT
eukprot:INCI12497.1.p1 GENE.INCI12497.1~~INCI12497.1.p1  ORF type:complete len:277 (-),score=22.17 INCI12497.1:103-933(-)